MVDGIGTWGGGESLAREITLGLSPERYEATFCVTRWEPRDEYEQAVEELRAAGVEFMGIERGSRFDVRPWRAVIAHLRERRVDILHTHKFGSNVWGSLLAPRAGVPVLVAHEHTWSFSGGRMRMLLDRRLIAARADAFVAVSREDRRKMIEVEGISSGKVRLIPNGISLEAAPDGSGAEARRALGLTSEQPVIGTVTTLRPQKALGVLLEATVRLRKRFPELAVLVIGGEEPDEPDEPKRLRRLATELGLDDSVRFLGLRSDIPELLAALDVAVLTSDYEGSPLSVMEFMEAACPVVATSVGGVPDIVADGETGLLVPPRDPVAFADAVAKLLADPALGRRLGEAGRRRRRSEFDLSNTIKSVERLYEELHELKGPRATS